MRARLKGLWPESDESVRGTTKILLNMWHACDLYSNCKHSSLFQSLRSDANILPIYPRRILSLTADNTDARVQVRVRPCYRQLQSTHVGLQINFFHINRTPI